MAPNMFKRLFGGSDSDKEGQTVVIQEIIEGGNPVAASVRTDPNMPTVAAPSTANQALVPGVSTGPLDVAKGVMQGLASVAQVVGGKAIELGQTQQGRDLTNSLASMVTLWITGGNQLTDEQRQALAVRLREDFTDLIKICNDVGASMTQPQGATSYSLMDAFNRMVPVSDELRIVSVPVGTGPLRIPKRASAATSDEDLVVRKLTVVPNHTPRTLATMAQRLGADARWAAQQLQLIQTDLMSARATRDLIINDAKSRMQSLSKELLTRLKSLRADISRPRGWLENLRESMLGQ